MSYELVPGEPITTAVPRLASELIERAITHLTDRSTAAPKRVHEARKRFKEMRALLRLVRFGLPDDFRFENAWFRDAGRSLAEARDADAVLEAIASLRVAAKEKRERELLRIAEKAMARPGPTRTADPGDGAAALLVPQLVLSRARVTTWPPIDDDFTPLRDGLRRTYADGRRAMQLALEQPLPERFHEWRKRVKDHWYHTQLLRNVSPEMKARMGALQQLSRTLGDHHDLFLVEQRLRDARETIPPEAVECALGAVQRHRASLETNAIAAGGLAYCEKPAALAKRIHSAWRAAVAGSRQ